MANNFVNKFAGEVLKNEIKKIAKEATTDLGAKLIKDGFSGTYNYISGSSKKSIEEKNVLNEKYDKVSNLLISTTANFKAYLEGIEETQGVINLYNLKLDTLNKKNPTYLISKNAFISQQSKWKTLQVTLLEDLTKKISKECLIVFRSKEESLFFNSHKKINSEIIECKNEEDVKKYKIDIYKRYTITSSIFIKDE